MDEYKVSFNSDTSDSEEEENRPAVKVPPAVGVANNIGENGDTTTLNEKTEEASQNGRIKQVNEVITESSEFSADGFIANGEASSTKCCGENGNIVGAGNGMNGVSDTENGSGRTVISAKDGILRTGSELNEAAADKLGETSDAEQLKNSCATSALEETSSDPGLAAHGGTGTAEGSVDAQQVIPNSDTSGESKVLENGDELVPSCDASIDLGKLGAFTLSTGLSNPCGESEMNYTEASSDFIMIKTTSSSVENETLAAGQELSTNVHCADTDKANDNKVGNDLQAPGSIVDSTETSESASTHAGRGTDDKLHSSEETMTDYRRPTARPMDETELLIQRILAEAKLEASGDTSAKEKTVGAERTRSVLGDGEQCLHDRRGLDMRLGNLFPSDERHDVWDDSGYEDPPSWTEHRGRRDVQSMRSRFRDNGRQYEQGTYRDMDGCYGRYGGGRNDDDEEEIVFEDSEFVPQRREETEEVVREKTTDIRNMVDKQATVLQKLKEASESFDDISAEIRAIKQDFLETQYRRSFAMDEYDDAPYYSYQPDSYRRDVPRYSSSYAGTYESPYAKPALSLDPELESDLPVANRSLGSLATTWAYSNSGSRSRYDTSYYPSHSSRYTSGLTGSSSYSSRSLFDDSADVDTEDRYCSNRALAPRDDDEDSTNGTRSYSFDSSLSSATSTLPTYRSKYGHISSLYSSGVGRYTGALSRASTLPDPTEHTGFTSRFLSKVRDQKNPGDEPKSPKRDKPFKSRFLRKSYDSDYGSHASTPATTPATTPSPVSHFPVLSCQPTSETSTVLNTDHHKLNNDTTA